MFELFVAKRYLRAKRKQVVISVITAISVVGVAAGVMSLVIALAIQNGFSTSLERNLLGLTAHVSIQEKEPAEGISDWRQLVQKLSTIPHVKSAGPALYDEAMLNGPVRSSGAMIKGIAIGPGAPVPVALETLKSCSITGLQTREGEDPAVILGVRLAEKMGAVTGKPVKLIISSLTPAGPRPRDQRLMVAGIFDSGFAPNDEFYAFMSLPDMQRIFGFGDVVNAVELYLDDVRKAPEVVSAATSLIPPTLAATSWQEQYRQMLNALKMERMVTVVTIGLIQLVAALNILIALVMMVMEKHRDIAVLISMGARAKQIRKIFVLEGAMIGAVGTVAGLTLGYIICYFADKYRWLRLQESIYPISYVPFNPRWIDGVWIAATAIAISLLATLYPARSATKIAPVEALRYD